MNGSPDVSADIHVEKVTTVEALESLRPEWSDLWKRCPSATPFQSPEWMLPWWKHLGRGELCALALRHEERLIGLAPLFIYTDPASPVRRLLLVGTGVTDYLDVLLDRDLVGVGAEAIFASLSRLRDQWDICDFQQLRSESPLLVAAPAEWSERIEPQEVCPVLSLPARVDELSWCVPSRQLSKLRYYRRRAEKTGSVRVDCVNDHNFEEHFDALLRLHRSRWAARGLLGVLGDEAVQRFHREAVRSLLARDVLRLYALRVGDRIGAVFYGFTHGKRAYYYVGGFDPAFERLSVGMLIVGHAIEEAICDDAEEFDFLRGREAYKYLWGAKDQLTYRRRLWRKAASPSF